MRGKVNLSLYSLIILISDSLVARVKYNRVYDRFEIDTNVEECSSDDNFNDEWIIVSGHECEYIDSTFFDVAVGEEDEFKYGKNVDVVKNDTFNGVHFQYYNQKRHLEQPTKDEMKQTAREEFPPWKNRGYDFVLDPKSCYFWSFWVWRF